MDTTDAPDQDTCCQLWKQSQEELVQLMLKLKEIAHKFNIETTRCLTGGGQGACIVHENGGSSTLSLKKVMDDLDNSVDNLQKEVYRHLFHAHSSVPMRCQRGRTGKRLFEIEFVSVAFENKIESGM